MTSKNMIKSKTLAGALVIALVTAAQLFGVEVTEAETASVQESVEAVIQLAGVLLVIWGRFAATTKLTVTGGGT